MSVLEKKNLNKKMASENSSDRNRYFGNGKSIRNENNKSNSQSNCKNGKRGNGQCGGKKETNKQQV